MISIANKKNETIKIADNSTNIIKLLTTTPFPCIEGYLILKISR